MSGKQPHHSGVHPHDGSLVNPHNSGGHSHDGATQSLDHNVAIKSYTYKFMMVYL